MTDEDWDEVFDDLVTRATRAVAESKASVSLASLSLETPVGYYDLRWLCHKRSSVLEAHGLHFDSEQVVLSRVEPVEQEPTEIAEIAREISEDGQVAIAYTSTAEQ